MRPLDCTRQLDFITPQGLSGIRTHCPDHGFELEHCSRDAGGEFGSHTADSIAKDAGKLNCKPTGTRAACVVSNDENLQTALANVGSRARLRMQLLAH
jgi:hypothetical protein